MSLAPPTQTGGGLGPSREAPDGITPAGPAAGHPSGGAAGGAGSGTGGGARGRLAAFARGRQDDPAWVRPALLGLLAATALLYLVGLSSSGWANAFYSAAVQAGSHSWKAFLFGSSDASNFITVDKPPASLWVMDIFARIFGVNSWSILVPQALEGVAAVGLLYLTIRRAAGAGAALLGAGVMALTPIAVLIFRFNNPDALLVLLLVAAAYAVSRAVEDGRTRWLVLASTFVGFAFLTKTLQAFIVVPVFALVYLAVGPTPVRRRLLQLGAATVALAVSSLWWVLLVQLWPAGSRPYVGGSRNNSEWNLIFGYNGFGRLSGNEAGSVGGGGFGGAGGGNGGGRWGATGLFRLFNSEFGGQASWLIPGALALLVIGMWFTASAPRTDRTRAGLLIWGGWLVLTGLVFSEAQGIIHPYYTVALAPAIGGVVGVGTGVLWARRRELLGASLLAGVVVGSAIWSYVLLDRDSGWHSWLRGLIIVLALIAAAGFLAPPFARPATGGASAPLGWGAPAGGGAGQRLGWWPGAAAIGLVAVLAGPAAYAFDTASTAHTGAIPSAGPAGGFGFGGGGRMRIFTGGTPGGPGGQGATGQGQGGFGQGQGGFGQGQGGGPGGPGGPGGFGQRQGGLGQGQPQGQGGFGGFGQGQGQGATRGGGGRVLGGGGGAGNLLNAGTPSADLVAALKKNANSFTWVAAATGSNSAAGIQLATGRPVMAIGGFNGTDPAPTLAQFEAYVRAGKIHYYIGGAGRGLGGGFGRALGGATSGGTSDPASQIASWVEKNFTATAIGGTTVYDLTAPANAQSA